MSPRHCAQQNRLSLSLSSLLHSLADVQSFAIGVRDCSRAKAPWLQHDLAHHTTLRILLSTIE